MRQSMALGMNIGLSTILLRDGSIFFVVLFINAVTGLAAGLVPNMALRSISLFLPTYAS
ncbi:hypothetical protein EIP86_003599 [Pleurotus ostreatoroseus]|nr:hypothetical protein EIP86_003599 [Pleurotus ostreatoroseus]